MEPNKTIYSDILEIALQCIANNPYQVQDWLDMEDTDLAILFDQVNFESNKDNPEYRKEFYKKFVSNFHCSLLPL